MWKKHGKGGDHLCTAESSKKKTTKTNWMVKTVKVITWKWEQKHFSIKILTLPRLRSRPVHAPFQITFFFKILFLFRNVEPLQELRSVSKKGILATMLQNHIFFNFKLPYLRTLLVTTKSKSSQFSVLLNSSNNPFQDFQISFQITPVSSRRQRIICNFAWKNH